MNYTQARWFTRVSGKRHITKIVVHDMESPDKPDKAEQIGRFFANLPSNRKASAHTGVDSNSACGYVRENDIAYAAPGANHDGLHLEMTGYARYTRGEWTQPQMMLMLQQAAQVIRDWSNRYNIPLRFLSSDEMRRHPDARGVTTHHEVSQAFRKSTHYDPGPHFPIGSLLTMAVSQLPPKQKEEPLPAYLHCKCPTGGYWLVKPTDGGIFSYEGAPFFKSLPALKVRLQAPIVDITPYLKDNVVTGYWLMSADGGVFSFGDAPYIDSYVNHPELHAGARDFIAIRAKDKGYIQLAVERGSDPPKLNPYNFQPAA